MGSSCNAGDLCSKDIEFKQIDMKVSKKNCNTLEKYGHGAVGRIEAKKMKIGYIKEIAELRAPSYEQDTSE